MIADRPWFGFGWNQPEPIYNRFYRAPKVDEGMAIQMNDYFTLGSTLGLPALAYFAAYIWLSFRGPSREHRKSNIEHRMPNEGTLLAVACRAGAIVLLVGFFFDGGLFKLATGATFWILLELGSERSVQSSKIKVQSKDGLQMQSS